MTEVPSPNRPSIGPYAIVEPLARGATSEVVKAFDSQRNHTVAIKILSGDLVRNADARTRFEQELRALTELDHPHIARIYASGITAEGRPYFAMEFIDGRSLMHLILEKTEMSLAEQLDLIIQSAEGFQAALNRNIIHCDVKPANLMVEMPDTLGNSPPESRDVLAVPRWRLKIVDFGLAKIIREDVWDNVAGGRIGTPRYMAPEVAMGRPADHRSDVYSLGATFYHLLTGRPPFDGDTPAAIMEQHISRSLIPPHLFNPEVPADIGEIVERAMAKEPNERYQDYNEMLADLKAAKVALLAKERRRCAMETSVGENGAQNEAAEESRIATGTSLRPPILTPTKHGRRLWIILAVCMVAALIGLAYLKRLKTTNESRRLLPTLVQTLIRRLDKGKSPGERPTDSQSEKPPSPNAP